MRQVNITAIPLQSAASINGAAIPAERFVQCSAQIAATGAAAGTLQLQASDDVSGADGFPGTPTNWSNVPSASISVTGSGAFLIPKTDLCYQWVRLIYTNTGTGTISVNLKVWGI